MLEGLDDVPWRRLKHAYGRADDVPDLLRALTTRQRLKRGEESALWHLFGNIHHQGTIYEATAYAVPFLLALVASRRTPDRVGILQLLAAIASGVPSGKGAKAARPAIAKGYETLVAITRAKGELRLNALNVLARLPEHSAKVQRMLLAAMRTERRPIGRVALVLLLGLVTKPSAATTAALTAALASGRRAERRVATVMLCRLPKARRPAGLEPAILEALEADDLEECVEGLPWDAAEDVMTIDLEACLPRKAAARGAERLIARVEGGTADDGHVTSLLELLFKRSRGVWEASKLSPLQARAVRALAKAVRGKRRIFYGGFSDWGLPETSREWRALAEGRAPDPIDMSLPELALVTRPRRLVRAGTLKRGDRIVHREYGAGTVTSARPSNGGTDLGVKFDDGGWIFFWFD